jgi:hypothetical protein
LRHGGPRKQQERCACQSFSNRGVHVIYPRPVRRASSRAGIAPLNYL